MVSKHHGPFAALASGPPCVLHQTRGAMVTPQPQHLVRFRKPRYNKARRLKLLAILVQQRRQCTLLEGRDKGTWASPQRQRYMTNSTARASPLA